MPEVFLEFLGDASPWLIPLLLLLYFWGKLNHDALHSRESHPESFERTIGWLRENNLGLLYLKALGWLMDKISDIIGDRQQFNQIYVTAAHPNGFIHKTFGLNPFTPESYDKCLRLAFLYPVISFLISWVLGSAGQVGNVDWLGQLEENTVALLGWQRWLLIGTTLLFVLGGLWWVNRWQGWRQWLALNIPFLLVSFLVFSAGQAWDNIIAIWSIMWFFAWAIFILLFVFFYLNGWLAGWLVYRSVQRAHAEIYRVAFSPAFAVSVTTVGIISAFFGVSGGTAAIADVSLSVLVAMSIAVVFAVSIASTITFVGAYAVAFGVASAITDPDPRRLVLFAAAGAIIVIFGAVQKWSKHNGKLGWFWLLYSVIFFMLGYISLNLLGLFEPSSWLSITYKYMIFLLFWLLLPLVNAPLDWLSLGVTRGLLQAVRTGRHPGSKALGFALADLVLALVFLFLITAVLVGVTALGNSVSGKTLVDIGGILQDVRCAPAKVDHWWIYFMLLSTLVPTLIHFALAGGAATLWIPRPVRLWLADGLERDQHKAFLAWLYLTFMPVLGFIVVPGALLYSLWWLVTTQDAWLGTHLLDWADMLAGRAADACPVPASGK